MKSTRTISNSKGNKFKKGEMYHFDNLLVVLCTINDDMLSGVVIGHPNPLEIGSIVRKDTNSAEFEIFHGAVTLEN